MDDFKDIVFISHILDAIADIEESTKNLSEEKLVANKDIRDATIRRLEVIGEAVKNISPAFREKHNNIEWSDIAKTRDKIIHKYFDVDYKIVWGIILNDLPALKEKLKRIKALAS